MGVCETCGNNYPKTFKIQIQSESHEFDCFECAIQALAPTCMHCGCRVIGHGVESGDRIFCCHHCQHAVEGQTYAEESLPI
ncbi:hypothetical protein [Bdellovibrio sp. HCB337]|uniref:hypothetical protein n=1 Tax=Bdellovibrio sp. HCB337 TaxID=3394358 RepID=UPI0039A72682